MADDVVFGEDNATFGEDQLIMGGSEGIVTLSWTVEVPTAAVLAEV